MPADDTRRTVILEAIREFYGLKMVGEDEGQVELANAIERALSQAEELA